MNLGHQSSSFGEVSVLPQQFATGNWTSGVDGWLGECQAQCLVQRWWYHSIHLPHIHPSHYLAHLYQVPMAWPGRQALTWCHREDLEAHADAKGIVLYSYQFCLIEFDVDQYPSTCWTGTHHPCSNCFLVVHTHLVYQYLFDLHLSALGWVLDWLVALPVFKSCLL